MLQTTPVGVVNSADAGHVVAPARLSLGSLYGLNTNFSNKIGG